MTTHSACANFATMQLLSIQVGQPREVDWDGEKVSTGIFKASVPGPVEVRKLGLAGDGQADPRYHGGVHKAVYGYGRDAYQWWKQELGRDLENGAFGENLTFDALDERTLCLGDVFALGSCELEVAEPRFPCFKLGIRFNDPKILKTFVRGDRPGIYFRVVKEGAIRPGDTFTRRHADPQQVSLWDLWDVQLKGCRDRERMARLLKVASLSPSWREKFQAKLGIE